MRKLLIIMVNSRGGGDTASQPLLTWLQANVGGKGFHEGLTIIITSTQHQIHFRTEKYLSLSTCLVTSECALSVKADLDCISVPPPLHFQNWHNCSQPPRPYSSLVWPHPHWSVSHIHTQSPYSQTERQKGSTPKKTLVWSTHLGIEFISPVVASSCQVETIREERQRCVVVIFWLLPELHVAISLPQPWLVHASPSDTKP